MKITRLDLDGCGSPMGLVARILEIEPDLPIPVPIENIARQLDILSIEDLATQGFAAALVTDVNKAKGAILVSGALSPERRRYSIGHELGHFLIPTHTVPIDGQFLCSREDMLQFSSREQERRQRMEFEANRFAALLLMPPPVLRCELAKAAPNLDEVVRLARLFAVSREAMARAYVEYSRHDIAIVRVHAGRILYPFRSREFPAIAPSIGGPVPDDCAWHESRRPGATTGIYPCDPDAWFDGRARRSIRSLTEQVMFQSNGYAMILLQADLRDEDEDEDDVDRRWNRRF